MRRNSFHDAGRMALVALALIALAAAPSRAGLIHAYNLTSSYNDLLGGPSLGHDGGTIGSDGYTFAANQGLTLSGGLPNVGTYSIATTFSFDVLTGYRKILDFNDLANDQGVYDFNASLSYFPGVTGPVNGFTAGVMARVVLTRDATTQVVTGYLDGVQQFRFVDASNLAVFSGPGGVIRFFEDDNITGRSEASRGVASQILVYDNALTAAEVGNLGVVPEPSSLVLAGIGLGSIGLLAARKRRARTA